MLDEYIDLILEDDAALEAQLKRIKWCIEIARNIRKGSEEIEDQLILERLLNNTMRDTMMILNGAIDKCLIGDPELRDMFKED